MKRKPSTRKGTATPKQKKFNPLSSENWISESTHQGLAASVQKLAPASSGSGGPCDNCHVDFKEDTVSVKWVKGSGNTYKAASNVKTDSGGWKPDVWRILSDSPKAKINASTGVVTFGSDGEAITIQAGVKRCPDCTNTFVLNIIRLQIFDGQDDVTGKDTKRLVGEKIDLYAIVTPVTFMPADGSYNWVVPGTVLKDYQPSLAADPVTPLPDAEKKNAHFYFHWVLGGPNPNTVSLDVNINGLAFSAKVPYRVTRPTASTQVVATAQPYILYDSSNPPNLQQWRLTAALKIQRLSGAPTMGVTAWLQTIGFAHVIAKRDNGNIGFEAPPAGPWPALDTHFPYFDDGDINATETGDAPGYTEIVNLSLTAHFEATFTMHLMYRSKRTESRWVPLRAINWSVDMRARRVGPPLAPAANYNIVAGSFLKYDKKDQDAPNSPDWKRTLKP